MSTRKTATSTLCQRLVEAVHEEGTARQVGERVVVREVAQLVFLASPLHLGDHAGPEDPHEPLRRRVQTQGLVVHHAEVAEGRALAVEERLAEEAHEVHFLEPLVSREESAQPVREIGAGAADDGLVGSAGQGELDALLVLSVLPGRDQAGASVPSVGELGHEGEAHAEEGGHVAHDGPEQLFAGERTDGKDDAAVEVVARAQRAVPEKTKQPRGEWAGILLAERRFALKHDPFFDPEST
jgi:hypothetical protein